MVNPHPGSRRPLHGPVAAVLVLAWAALFPGACANGQPPWQCKAFGQERRCERPFEPPGADGWDCYVVKDTAACVGPAGSNADAPWSCDRALGSTLCIAPGLAAPAEPSPDGWQCFVDGSRILCDWSRYGNDAWKCSEDLCRESQPDLPSPDEWECIEASWGVLCRGLFLHDVHPRWSCVPYKDRFLCLDPNPDLPHQGNPGAWECRHDNSMRTGRICKTTDRNPCEPCPGLCRDGRCYPAYRKASCYFNEECEEGKKCLFGTCVAK
jgi:hypothetical protein